MTVLSIAGAVTVGAISPGPSFVMVARISVSSTRADGVAAALGMGLGACIFSIAVLLGLHALFALVPWIFVGMKIAGGTYLIYLGFRIWKGASSPLRIDPKTGERLLPARRRSFLVGLGTQLSNPKTAVVYTSIFAAFMPDEVTLALMLVLPVIVFLIEGGWYAIVACTLSATSPRSAYLSCKVWVDRIAGTVMGLLGLKLITSSIEGQ